MNEQDVFRIIAETISREFGVPAEKITEQSRFNEDLGLDSLDTIELGMSLENEFNINVPADLDENVKTVGQAVTEIIKLLPKA